MATVLTELQTLKQAYARGVLVVQRNGRTITYANGKDLRDRIAYLEAQENTSTSSLKPRYQRAVFDDD